MKRKFAIFMVMLLAFALLISTTTITVSAETTYTPIGGSATFAKKLVVNSDTNIPNITFSYTIRRANAIAATASTVEILEANRAGNVETAVYTNNDTAGAIFGLSTKEFIISFKFLEFDFIVLFELMLLFVLPFKFSLLLF